MSVGTFTTPPSEIQMIIAARQFQTKDNVWLKEDIHLARPGAGSSIYAKKGELVTIMSYDPTKNEAYGIRSLRRNPDGSAVESYRNCQVREDQLSRWLVHADAESVGL